MCEVIYRKKMADEFGCLARQCKTWLRNKGNQKNTIELVVQLNSAKCCCRVSQFLKGSLLQRRARGRLLPGELLIAGAKFSSLCFFWQEHFLLFYKKLLRQVAFPNSNASLQMGETGANALRLMGLFCGHRPQNKSNSTPSATVNSYKAKFVDLKIRLRTIT